MKIRNGFVSNSSSSSFAIPMSFLTDEQTEMLLSIDDSKDTKKNLAQCTGVNSFINPVDDYPKNDNYHKIYNDMIGAGEWWDSTWTTSIESDGSLLTGGTLMWNGTIGLFMEKIGINITALEITSPGIVQMSSNPEALKVFAKKRNESIKWYNGLPEDCVEKEYLLDGPIEDNPYELDDSEFEEYRGRLEFESEDGYSYIKRIEK